MNFNVDGLNFNVYALNFNVDGLNFNVDGLNFIPAVEIPGFGTLGRWDVGTLGLKFPGRWDVGRDVGTLELKFNVSDLDLKSNFQTKLYQ